MRAYIMVADLAALAMFAVAHTTSTEDRVIGAPACTADCSGHEAEADNGVGSRLPVDPSDFDDDDNSRNP
jgi:hypothetical protein